MKIRTTMIQRWAFGLPTTMAIGTFVILTQNVFWLLGEVPVLLFMWKLIDWGVEYQDELEAGKIIKGTTNPVKETKRE